MLPSRSVHHRSGVAGAEEHQLRQAELTQLFMLQCYLYRELISVDARQSEIIAAVLDKGIDSIIWEMSKLTIASVWRMIVALCLMYIFFFRNLHSIPNRTLTILLKI